MNPIVEIVRHYLSANNKVICVTLFKADGRAKLNVTFEDGKVETHDLGAKAEREVAERKAAALVEQIQRTTDAETEKQLAITEATKLKESAEIAEQTARILLEKAKVDAEAVQVAADAEAYQKREILAADNALAQKLEAYIAVNEKWADAFARRQVPATVFGGGGSGPGGPANGSDFDASQFMEILTVRAAQGLDLETSIAKDPQ